MLDNPSEKEFLSHIQPKPPLEQPEALSSCPVSLGRETDTHSLSACPGPSAEPSHPPAHQHSHPYSYINTCTRGEKQMENMSFFHRLLGQDSPSFAYLPAPQYLSLAAARQGVYLSGNWACTFFKLFWHWRGWGTRHNRSDGQSYTSHNLQAAASFVFCPVKLPFPPHHHLHIFLWGWGPAGSTPGACEQPPTQQQLWSTHNYPEMPPSKEQHLLILLMTDIFPASISSKLPAIHSRSLG